MESSSCTSAKFGQVADASIVRRLILKPLSNPRLGSPTTHHPTWIDPPTTHDPLWIDPTTTRDPPWIDCPAIHHPFELILLQAIVSLELAFQQPITLYN